MGSPTISKIRPESVAIPVDDGDSTYIRGFLAKVKPLEGCTVRDEYWEGRSLIERLALALEVNEDCHWDATQCATVLDFLGLTQPVNGICFCNDGSYSSTNATCGFHVILNFMRDEVRRLAPAPKAKGRKPEAEVATHA